MTAKDVRVEISKNSTEQIVVERTVYHGVELVHLRIWFNAGDPATPEWRPTPKGICFKIEQMPDVLAALEKIATAESRDNG